jgi:hypothetical protein
MAHNIMHCCCAGSVLKHTRGLPQLAVRPLLSLQHFLVVLCLIQVPRSKRSKVLPEAQI